MSTKNNFSRGALIAAVAAVLVALAAVLGFAAVRQAGQNPLARTDDAYEADDEDFTDTVLLDGVEYEPNPALHTILFMGLDKSEEQIEYQHFGEGARADVLLMLILNDSDSTMQLLQISRNCMVDVDIYDGHDQPLGTLYEQITLQHTMATSLQRANWLTARKVGELLYGIQPDATVSLSMQGIEPLVTALGGVTVTMEADYTDIDPAFVQGATLTLNGKQAYHYLHDRDTTRHGTNEERMRRQAALLQAMAARMKGADPDLLQLLMDAAGPHLESTVDAETLQKCTRYTLLQPFELVPGTLQEGSHDEYIVDAEALRRLVIRLFYRPVE